jgi:oxygen-dependent protoporphyrinogen oxidase
MPRVVVVGGGISGLTLAYRLQQGRADLDVVVLERAARAGGTVETIHRDGFRVEAGPNGFVDAKPDAYGLCRELGLEGRLVAASEASSRNRYLLMGGRLRRLPASLPELLTTDVLGWPAKVALLLERFRPSRPPPQDESIAAFARRRAGREIATTVADAFVTGVYAGDPRRLSVRACFPRLAGLEREHGSVLRGLARERHSGLRRGPGRLWSFPEGLALLTDTLGSRLRRPPTLGVRAAMLARVQGPGIAWRVTAEGGDAWDADVVALCCPAPEQARLLSGLDPCLAADVGGIEYNRVAVVALGYRAADVPRPMDGFGYLSPRRPDRDVLGVQWCSSVFPGRAPAGMVLLRALCGGWDRPDVVGWDDEQLVAAVQHELAAVLGVRAAPAFREIIRWPRAIPQYHLGHLDRVRRVEERTRLHPGLFLGGNAYRGVALNDCVAQGAALAQRILGYLGGGSH